MRKKNMELLEIMTIFISSSMVALMAILVIGISLEKEEVSAIELPVAQTVGIVEEKNDEVEVKEPIVRIETKQARIKNANGLNIRKESSGDSKVVDVIYRDEIFNVDVVYLDGELDNKEWLVLSDSKNFVCSEFVEILDKEIDISKYIKTNKGTFIKYVPKVISSNVTHKSNLTVSDMKKITKGTNLYNVAEAIIEVEKKYNINAFFTYAVAALESSYGDSSMARSKNNLFGMNAVDSNPNLAYSYNSMSESIKDFGRRIDKYYVKNGRNTVSSINARYSTDTNWGGKVHDIMNKAYLKVK